MKMFEGVKCERVSLYSMSVDTSNLTQTIRIPSEVNLSKIRGDISQLLDLIETSRMGLNSLTLDENSTKSLTKMLQDRVMRLSLDEVEMDFKLLTEYEGNGVCQVSNKRRWKMSSPSIGL